MTKRDRNQGQLEAEVLEILWDARESSTPALSSGEILSRLDGDLALTTVLTVLTRIVDKGLVARRPAEGRGFVFEAAKTREQHHAELLLKIVDGDSNLALTFAHFAKGLSPESLKSLRESLGSGDE